MENFFLLLRVIVSLAAVLGLLFYLRKRILPRFGSPNTSKVTVVERQGIGPKSSVVLLDVQGRRYLLGVGESSINVLDSFEAPEPPVVAPAAAESLDGSAVHRSQSFALSLQKLTGSVGAPGATAASGPEPVPGEATPVQARHAAAPVPGALAGSILSPATWQRAWTAVKTGRSA